jgi:hypothetical protein
MCKTYQLRKAWGSHRGNHKPYIEDGQQYNDQKTKNNNTTSKSQRTTILRPKDKEQQYSVQKTKNNNTATKRQRATIQRPKDKENLEVDKQKHQLILER